MDRAPTGKHFGDVLQPVNPTYRMVRLTQRSRDPLEISVWKWGGRYCLMSPPASNHATDQLLATKILKIVHISAEALQT